MTKDASLASAIYEYIVAMPSSEVTGEGPIEVRVDLQPTDTGSTTGALFISMPFHGGDRDWLTKLMARVRDGFKRDEIPSTHRVTVGEDEPFDAFDDEGRRLLHLPAHLTIEPR
jgi:hypothetical protein